MTLQNTSENLTFDQAFQNARNSGYTTFSFEGKTYNTRLENETEDDWYNALQQNYNSKWLRTPDIEGFSKQINAELAANSLQFLYDSKNLDVESFTNPFSSNYDIRKASKWSLFDPDQYTNPLHPKYDFKKSAAYYLTGQNPLLQMPYYANDPDVQKWKLREDRIKQEIENYNRNIFTSPIPTIDDKKTWASIGDINVEIPLANAVSNQLNLTDYSGNPGIIHDRMKITPEQIKEWDPFGHWSEMYLDSGTLGRTHLNNQALDYRNSVADSLHKSYMEALQRGSRIAAQKDLRRSIDNPLSNLRGVHAGNYTFSAEIESAGDYAAEQTRQVMADPDARAWLEINNQSFQSPEDAKLQAMQSTATQYGLANLTGIAIPTIGSAFLRGTKWLNFNTGKALIRKGFPRLGKALGRYGVIDAPIDLYFMGDTVARAAKGQDVSGWDWAWGVGLPGALLFRKPLFRGLKYLNKPSVYKPIAGIGVAGLGLNYATNPLFQSTQNFTPTAQQNTPYLNNSMESNWKL